MTRPSLAPTAEEFAAQYAARSGVTVEWLKANGREARPCDCGDACQGWQMAHLDDNSLQFAAPGGVTP